MESKDKTGSDSMSNTDSAYYSNEYSSSFNTQPESTSFTPKHGLNSVSSDHSLSKGLSTRNDSGLGSSGPYSSSNSSENCSIQEISDSRPNLGIPKFQQYLQLFQYLLCHFPDSLTWTKEHFSGSLSKEEVAAAGRALWAKTECDEDEDFEAINAARDQDIPAVLFALYMAPDAKTLDTKNLDRHTVLHVAAELLPPQVTRLLICKGADGAITDLWGNTPLHIASRLGRADVIRDLTTKIAREELGHPCYKVPYRSLPQDNRDQMNNDGRAPVHLAAQGGHADALRALAKAKVDLDQRRLGDGYAALHIAIDWGYYECVEALLECGADLEVKNHKGEKPQQLAFLCDRQNMVQLCDRFHASPNQLQFAETEQVEWSSSEDDSDDMDTMDDESLSDCVEQMSL